MRPYCNKKAPLPPRYPVREWLGRYEAYLLNMYGRRTYRYSYPTLEMFFEFFTSEWSLERFTIVEVSDYIQWRRRRGCTVRSCMTEVGILRKYWRWLIEERGLNLLNPVSPAHQKKLSDALIAEAKGKSSGFTKVEVPASDERSPVYYDDIYDMLV